jgi:acetyl-CoA carboxylase carboxyl transferase subunit alpha
MANPEGYRKALRLMWRIEKFGIPVVTLIELRRLSRTGKEERGQGDCKKYLMVRLQVPIITIVSEGVQVEYFG